jgi:hypothetical protein
MTSTSNALVSASLRFDYVLAQSIFSHCGPDLFGKWMPQVASLLGDDEVLVATFIESAEDNRTNGWFYPDCVAYSPATVAALAAARAYSSSLGARPRQGWAFSRQAGPRPVHAHGAGLGLEYQLRPLRGPQAAALTSPAAPGARCRARRAYSGFAQR